MPSDSKLNIHFIYMKTINASPLYSERMYGIYARVHASSLLSDTTRREIMDLLAHVSNKSISNLYIQRMYLNF